jgi:iron complex transport system permease protein
MSTRIALSRRCCCRCFSAALANRFNLCGVTARAVGQALWQPDIDNIQQMLFHYSLLPRLAISLLVGAGLGLVGVLFQQVLRNPLAEPTTLGVATGAQLGSPSPRCGRCPAR